VEEQRKTTETLRHVNCHLLLFDFGDKCGRRQKSIQRFSRFICGQTDRHWNKGFLLLFLANEPKADTRRTDQSVIKMKNVAAAKISPFLSPPQREVQHGTI
jgi:hypothetical protein